MLQSVTAIYQNGMLRPLGRVKLKESQTVRVNIIQLETQDEKEKVLQALSESGMVTLSNETSTIDPVSEERRKELARIFSIGKPISELIIEERSTGW